MQFAKYQGTGNDFVMMDNRAGSHQLSEQQIAHICHRRFGVGADGLIMLENAQGFDFRMIYYNADGREGSMCGNGGRCAVKFAFDLGLVTSKVHFVAVDGEHHATVYTDGRVALQMIDVAEVDIQPNYVFLNTGSPHYIEFVEEAHTTEVVTRGRAIRYSDEWQPRGGTNVNFVEVTGSSAVKVRTYERGVEDETYSCGTGVTAASIAAYLTHGIPPPIHITTLGGPLEVQFNADEPGVFKEIYLIGPAKKVFEGYLPTIK